MDGIAKALFTAREFWRRLGANQKVTIVLSAVVLVAVTAGVLAWSSRPDYVLLYSNLAAEDAWSVVEALNKQSVPYKFSQNGSAIHVMMTRKVADSGNGYHYHRLRFHHCGAARSQGDSRSGRMGPARARAGQL